LQVDGGYHSQRLAADAQRDRKLRALGYPQSQGAQVYFENIEIVNRRVLEGLSEEARKRFEETLPVFVGFLAGHGLATLLTRFPNPVVAGVGVALKGLLAAAGYVMQIDVAGEALQRLLTAGAHLVRVRKVEGDKLSSLSAHHVEEA
jgi:hypothetical protein